MRLIIMRGCPFTGKSFTARAILAQNNNEGVILSTDDFWYTQFRPDNAEYTFDVRLLGVAHCWNRRRALKHIKIGCPLIIIDNTNTMASEFCCDYLLPAWQHNYELTIQEPTSDRWQVIRQLLLDKHKNKTALDEWAIRLAEGSKETHNVPAEAIRKMMSRWECDLDPIQVFNDCMTNHK
jgi:hypothetical protein